MMSKLLSLALGIIVKRSMYIYKNIVYDFINIIQKGLLKIHKIIKKSLNGNLKRNMDMVKQ